MRGIGWRKTKNLTPLKLSIKALRGSLLDDETDAEPRRAIKKFADGADLRRNTGIGSKVD